MKYDVIILPRGSVERAKAQLEKDDLIAAIGTCHIGNLGFQCLQTELDQCLVRTYVRRNFGLILSAYYVAGVFGKFTVVELLTLLFNTKNYPTFLKQAYRFDVYSGFETQIQTAIEWHTYRKLNDAGAWQKKFAKLAEQVELHTNPRSEEMVISSEEPTNGLPADSVKYKLKSAIATQSKSRVLKPLPTDDPYIVSQTARVKMEYANQSHQETLALLRDFLAKQNITFSENKLIDNFCFLSDRPAIFEIKSINKDNEREQIRHAISQLYEYRFLHSLFDASLWVVFSVKPSSQWYIDYLLGDRNINVLWIEEGKLSGPSVGEFTRGEA